MVGRTVPPLPSERPAPADAATCRRCRCADVVAATTHGAVALLERRRPRGRAPASSSASPAWPATASASCTRWPSGLRGADVGHGARSPASSRRAATRATRSAAGAVGVPEDPVAERSCPASTCSSHVALGDLAPVRKRPRHRLGEGPAALPTSCNDGQRAAHGADGDRPLADAVGRQHPAGHARAGARRRAPRWSSPPTRAAGSTSPPPDAPRSCCSNGGPPAPACC